MNRNQARIDKLLLNIDKPKTIVAKNDNIEEVLGYYQQNSVRHLAKTVHSSNLNIAMGKWSTLVSLGKKC